MNHKKNYKFNDRLDEIDTSSDDFEEENISISTKIRSFFFKFIFVISLFLSSIIIAWYASTDSQRIQINSFVQQLLRGNVDFSIFQETNFQILGNFSLPEQEEQQKKINSFPKQNNPIQQYTAPKVKIYSSSNKYENLYSCNARITQRNNKIKIYKWKDSDGQMHMTDKFPKNEIYHNLKILNYKSDSFFSLNLDSRYSKLPAFASDRMKRDVNQIYKILNNNVGVSQLNPITFNLKLFDDKNTFNTYKIKVAPNMGTAGGFYISKINEASVYTGRNDQRMYEVTRHEATHAIVNGAFGQIPTWLNEGLAEYFEELSFKNSMTRIIALDETRLDSLAKNGLPSLTTYFNMTNKQWYSESNKNKHYSLGWSLVYFMMSSKNDKQFLKYMLDHLAYNYCKPFSDIQYINKHYPGGLTGFERNWKKWLVSSKRDHYY
ncbi:MAG: DUF1570 domain-containing protein [Gammaproteobacteria bacterium]|nr:DUF1570 domain-containing protein [Gammaproteobacteria bacterium]